VKGTRNDIAEDILKTTMDSFANMVSKNPGWSLSKKKERLHGMLKVVTELSTLKCFRKKFLVPNNLKWLNDLEWNLLDKDVLGFSSNSPMGALNSWLQLTEDLNKGNLSFRQRRAITDSGILHYSQDKSAQMSPSLLNL
jgi:hypothetical protein